MSERVVLLVDDSPSILKALKRTFNLTGGYRVITAESAREALDILPRDSIDVMITDENMPEMPGTELLRIVRVLYPSTVTIMLTGQNDLEVAKNAINSGQIYRFFTKPWDDYELLLSVRQALEHKQLEVENALLRRTVEHQQTMLERMKAERPDANDRQPVDLGTGTPGSKR